MFFFHVIVHLVLLCLAAQTQRARAEDNLLIKWEDLSQAACDANANDWEKLQHLGDFSPASGFRRQTSTSKPAYMKGTPHSIWYKLPQPVIVGKFSFRNRADGSGTEPVDIDLIGSKDCNNWTEIFTVDGLTWSQPDEQKEFRIEDPVKHKVMRDNAFSCYGIKIRKSTNSGPCLQDIKMWRLDESEAVTEKANAVTEDPKPVTEEPNAVTEDPKPVTEEPNALTKDLKSMIEKPNAVTEDPKPVTGEPNTVAKDLKSMVEVLTKLSNTVNKNTEHFQQLRKRLEKLPGPV